MDLPAIDLDVFLNNPLSAPETQAECLKAASALITYGALVLHDSRTSEAANDAFLDLLEDYFAQPEADLRRDERPELSYQVGVTLENTEKPKCAVDEPCLEVIQRLAPEQRPLDISAHQPDPKCRFFWSLAERPPYETEFPGLNAANSMRESVAGLAQMVAVGLGLPADYFTNAAKYGPHLLAPTASDLVKYGAKDTILAGFHTDLNFLTIHGRSRYPGLNIWARNTGNRIPVKIPPGNYLLVQAGKQIEHITGGLIKAGFHEVTVNEKTVETIERRKAQFPDRPLIRISSTCFWHLSSDFDLKPVPELAERARQVRAEQFNLGRDEGREVEYPPMKVGHQVQGELKHIALMI
ncbi:hypothetical protein NLU13_0098 [Sarocladium strictum]|uniref:Isopenicillin N synthase-like Fe(2+) 2OG dioxygenase domain-containing protein n=1 Tax=Sarocladium strictum TaxID=5046 RepID=A0AA39GQB8_SARSR|nr:hypothetical protein NLU13_0098 [Sarocladium strictum]